jgi:hypothetical protein
VEPFERTRMLAHSLVEFICPPHIGLTIDTEECRHWRLIEAQPSART